MYQPFLNDFIRNRGVRLSLVLSLLFDISLTKSVKHALILFGLPYLTSIVMNYHFKPVKNNKIKARISEQYRNKHNSS